MLLVAAQRSSQSSRKVPRVPLYDTSTVSKYTKSGDFQNNANISLRNRYLYFAVDKVANSSIKNALFQLEYAPVGKDIVTLYDKRSSPLLSPYQMNDDTFRQVFNSGNFFRFTFVRNPYTRLLSCYLDRIRRQTSNPRRQLNVYLRSRNIDPVDVSFETFIRAACEQNSPTQNSHWRVQYDDTLFEYIDYDYVGKFESLWADMEIVSQRIWGELKPEMADNSVNKSPRITNAGSRTLEFYTPELTQMVADRYANDFRFFGYSTDIDKV